MFGRKRDMDESVQAGKKTKKTENVYVGNKREDDDRYANSSVRSDNWRKAFQLVVALLFMSMFFNGYYMMTNKLVPYIVEVDKFGNIIRVGVVDKANPMDHKRIIRKTMDNWISNARRISGDQIAQKDFINYVYARVERTGLAKTMLDEFYKDRNIWDTATKFSVSTETTLLLPGPGKTYNVEWTETWRNLKGEIIKTERWKALLTYEITPLDTEVGIDRNPEGMFITDFSWSKQI